jgi:hypothetical protein
VNLGVAWRNLGRCLNREPRLVDRSIYLGIARGAKQNGPQVLDLSSLCKPSSQPLSSQIPQIRESKTLERHNQLATPTHSSKPRHLHWLLQKSAQRQATASCRQWTPTHTHDHLISPRRRRVDDALGDRRPGYRLRELRCCHQLGALICSETQWRGRAWSGPARCGGLTEFSTVVISVTLSSRRGTTSGRW